MKEWINANRFLLVSTMLGAAAWYIVNATFVTAPRAEAARDEEAAVANRARYIAGAVKPYLATQKTLSQQIAEANAKRADYERYLRELKTTISFRWDREYVMPTDVKDAGEFYRSRRDTLLRRCQQTRNYLGRPVWDTQSQNKAGHIFGFPAMMETKDYPENLKRLNIIDLMLAMAVECKVESVRRCDFMSMDGQALPPRFEPIAFLFTAPEGGVKPPQPVQFAFSVRGDERAVMEFLFAMQRRDKAGKQHQYITLDRVEVAKDGEFLDPGNTLVTASGTGVILEVDPAQTWVNSTEGDRPRKRR